MENQIFVMAYQQNGDSLSLTHFLPSGGVNEQSVNLRPVKLECGRRRPHRTAPAFQSHLWADLVPDSPT